MSIDHSDEVGWPAEPTRVYATPRPRHGVHIPLVLAKDRRNQLARERYAALRAAGLSVKEARKRRAA